MTEAMPFLQKYDITFLRPPTITAGIFLVVYLFSSVFSAEVSGVSGSVEGLSSI